MRRTLQDYLGARAVIEIEEGDFGPLVDHAADSRWKDIVRMAVAHALANGRTGYGS
ncbi:hypothetical protein [Streptomyces sp. CT34]|uniref:hypothetical protein n=1 Tax=Streptomyces sp. CT34 TaxID=1553907 RepID=UPI0012FF1004